MGKIILYNTQISMYDKKTGKLIPEADGNINMMRNTILEWRKYFPNDMFLILLPSELKDKVYSILPRGFKNAMPIFYDDYVVSARINRYNFPMNQISSIIREKNIKIDILINDVIEITGNFKQMFNINFGYIPKIISNIRHTDDSIQSGYIYRVVDGIKNSDVVTILSESMINRLVNQMHFAGIDGEYISMMFSKHKMKVFEPSISLDELYSYASRGRVRDTSIMTITFPGRLSIGEENRTHWDKFIEAIKLLRAKRQDFEVYFTDPNNSIDMTISGLDWVKTIPRDRIVFLELLSKTDIIVSLMSVEGFGGISIREALIMGCLPIIPYTDEYKKMASKYYPGFLSLPITSNSIYDRLNWAIEKLKSDTLKDVHTYKDYGSQFSIQKQFEKLIPVFGGIR